MNAEAQFYRCPACGAAVPRGAIACSSCGWRVSGGQYQQMAQPPHGHSRLRRMVYYNMVGRHVARAIGFLILLMILAGIALVLLVL